MESSNLYSMDVVILCGGLGTRLKKVMGDRPKVLARFGKKTFLDILLGRLIQSGFRRFILSTGHLGEQVEDHVAQYYGKNSEAEVLVVRELEPLGTGGGLKNVLSHVKSDPFFVMNGDSFAEVDFGALSDFHRVKKGTVSIALVEDFKPDGGGVIIGDSCKMESFREKSGVPTKFMNSGIYVMDKNVVRHMPKTDSFSLEYDVFPVLASDGLCFGFPSGGKILDIGTPERFEEAQHLFHEG